MYGTVNADRLFCYTATHDRCRNARGTILVFAGAVTQQKNVTAVYTLEGNKYSVYILFQCAGNLLDLWKFHQF